MEFWGVEVKAGKPVKVLPKPGKLIHISQAALGEGKKGKGNDFVPLRLNIDDKKYVIGTLTVENTPQLTFDLVFERKFELSHDWKNGSIYFVGYTADDPLWEGGDDSGEEFSSDEDEDHPIETPENGKLEPKVEKAKPEPSAKPKVTLVEPSKVDESDDEDDEDIDEEDDSDDFDEGEDLPDIDDEDSDEDEDTNDDDEETPQKADLGKKRSVESATKTPAPAKKAKLATPQKTDGKKDGGHIATPYPSKQAGKAPASGNKKEQTPKSGAQVSCKSCSKTFNSENALESHTKAKHSGK